MPAFAPLVPWILGVGRAAWPYVRAGAGFTRGGKGLSRRGIAQNIGVAGAGVYGTTSYLGEKGLEREEDDFFDKRAWIDSHRFADSIEKSVEDKDDPDKKDSLKEDDDDPFNTNQLFLASILKGLKKDYKAVPARGQGTYIPRPDLPSMSRDWESNKTYWNIG
jgi:hypothetical protein